jgi:PAS domain S-box-containing protein
LDNITKETELFSKAIETSLDGIVIGDVEGNITYVNDALAKMYGSNDKKELVGRHVIEFIVESERPRALQNSLNSIRTGQGWKGKFTLQLKGDLTLPIEVTATPIKDEKGVPIGFIDIIRDITERTENEEKLKEANRKLELANEKLLVADGIVRHEIANKISFLNSSAYLAKKNGKVDEIFKAAEITCTYVTRALDFSRNYEMLGYATSDYIHVDEVFDEVIAMFPNVTEIKIVNCCQGLEVWADSLLRELFYNLVENTLKYGEKTSQIKLSYTQGKGSLKLFYEDDGVGIPSDMKTKLFTKGYGKGTGLGLYLIEKTLEVYGWQIQETGAEGKGAKFEITIPEKSQNKLNYKTLNHKE